MDSKSSYFVIMPYICILHTIHKTLGVCFWSLRNFIDVHTNVTCTVMFSLTGSNKDVYARVSSLLLWRLPDREHVQPEWGRRGHEEICLQVKCCRRTQSGWVKVGLCIELCLYLAFWLDTLLNTKAVLQSLDLAIVKLSEIHSVMQTNECLFFFFLKAWKYYNFISFTKRDNSWVIVYICSCWNPLWLKAL